MRDRRAERVRRHVGRGTWPARVLALVLAGGLAAAVGCSRSASGPAAPPVQADAEPCPTEPSVARPPAAADAVPRIAVDSPFEGDYQPPVFREGKRLWAKSCLYAEAPKLVVETWLTERPETAGKYVLVEFWATWCPPCRRSIALLNGFHEKFGKELVVIGLSDETEEAVRRLKDPQIRYYSAVDTQARMKRELGVFGIPHVIVIEPGGYVVWEGFPLWKDHELTEAKIEKILAVGRKQ